MDLKFTLNRGNRYPEGAALIFTRTQLQIPSVRLGDLFGDGKPQSAAAGFGIAGIIDA